MDLKEESRGEPKRAEERYLCQVLRRLVHPSPVVVYATLGVHPKGLSEVIRHGERDLHKRRVIEWP